jgi:hypothetical protein
MGFLPKIGTGSPPPAAKTDAPLKTDAPAVQSGTPPPGTQPTGTPNWSATTNVQGDPRRVDMRMGKDAASQAAQNQMPIACPVLKALVAEGSVHVDGNGRVQTKELLNALQAHGLTGPMLETIKGITYFANEPKDIPKNVAEGSFDVMHLRSGMTMHDSDSNILSQGHFDEAAFDRFTSHANNGWMDEKALAAAVETDTSHDMKAQNPLTALTFGQNAVLAEYPVLLKMFGTTGPDGKPAIKVDDLKAFWKDGKLPMPGAEPGSVSLLGSTAAYASMLLKVDPKLAMDALHSGVTATGLSHEGARLSTDKDQLGGAKATENAGKGAGVAAKCPFLGGGAPMPIPLAGTLDIHQ